jgi:hypothetical protein
MSRILAFTLLFALAGPLFAQVNFGTIDGQLLNPDGTPVQGLKVELTNALTGFHAEIVTAADGSFRFQNVPFNPYLIHAEPMGYQPVFQSVELRTSVPLAIKIQLSPMITESVTVKGDKGAAQLETDTSTTHIDIDKSYIAKAPATVSSRAMEQIVTSTPGFAKDENGRFHFQGAHSQGEYVLDGQTISDQTGLTFSNSIDPGIAQSLEVIYGNVPAEYGEKIGAVINMGTRSGLGAGNLKGEVLLGAADFSTLEGGIDLLAGTSKYGLFASLNASESDRLLDPVNPDNLNNDGRIQRGFMRFDYAPGTTDNFRLTLLTGETHRGVPNTFSQEAAGQDQRVVTKDENVNFGWQHVASGNSVFDLNVFGRFSTFALDPSAQDAPVTASSDRSLDNYGIHPAWTWILGTHELKAGAVYKRIPVDETFAFGITDPNFVADSGNPNLAPYDLTAGGSEFRFHDARTGTYYAGYVQDDIRLKDFTANLGVRYDHNDLPVTDQQLEPRVGVAYHVESWGTVWRASYNRVLYTPEIENLLFSSSPQAATLVPPAIQASLALGGGVLQVHSEVQNAYDAGFQQALGSRLRLDVDFWQRQGHDAGDQDQFLNTGIVFPLAFQSSDLHGWNVRLDMAQVGGVHGFLSVGHTRAVYVAPPVGGLFLDAGAIATLTGGPFLIDHDQNLQIQSAWIYDFGQSGFWAGTNVRYDSGLVTDTDVATLEADPDNAFAARFVREHSGGPYDPNRIAPRTIWDFSTGVDFKKYGAPLTAQIDLLNAFDQEGVYNILSVFGGTHVIPPRTLAARLRYQF